GRRARRGPRAPQVHDRDPCHPAVLRRQPRLARRRRRRRTRPPPRLAPPPCRGRGPTLLVRIIAALQWEGHEMRKDVREFIRRLESVGLTVEPTPGHYRVLPGGEPLPKQKGV